MWNQAYLFGIHCIIIKVIGFFSRSEDGLMNVFRQKKAEFRNKHTHSYLDASKSIVCDVGLIEKCWCQNEIFDVFKPQASRMNWVVSTFVSRKKKNLTPSWTIRSDKKRRGASILNTFSSQKNNECHEMNKRKQREKYLSFNGFFSSLHRSNEIH